MENLRNSYFNLFEYWEGHIQGTVEEINPYYSSKHEHEMWCYE